MRYFMVFLILCTLVLSCDDSKKNADDTKDKIEYELFSSTHLMDENSLSEIISVDDSGTFLFKSDSLYAKSLQNNHIILAPLDIGSFKGMIRQVESMNFTGSEIKVTTKEAPIQRAFKKLHLSINHRNLELSNSGIDWDVTPGTVVTKTLRDGRGSGGTDFGPFTIDYYPFNGDNDIKTKEDQVHVVATFNGGIHYTLGIDFDWPDGEDVLTGDFLPEIDAGFYLYAGAGAVLNGEGMAIKSFSREDKIGHADLGSFYIGPLYFTVSADLISEIKGGGKSSFRFSSGAKASFEAGVLYSTDDGGKAVPPTPVFTMEPVTAEVTESANVRISVGPRIKLLLYGTVGPYAGVKLYGELNADTDRDAEKCWESKIGLEGEVGIELALFGSTLADWGSDFNIMSKELASGSCYEDPEKETPPDISDPAFDFWTLRATDSAYTWNHSDVLRLVQTIDSDWILTGDCIKKLFKFRENGTFLWSEEFYDEESLFDLPLRIKNAEPTSAAGIIVLTENPTGIMNLSNGGTILWNKMATLDAESQYGLRTVTEVDDGYIIGGAILDSNLGYNDSWIFKIDKKGELLWSKKFGTENGDERITSIVKSSSGFYVAGNIFSVSQTPATQAFLLYFEDNGNLKWEKRISGSGSTGSFSINDAIISHDGDIITTGSFGDGNSTAFIAKFKKEEGALGWINGISNDTISTLGMISNQLIQLSDGGYLVSGAIWTAGSTDYMFVSRTDGVGRNVWSKRISDLNSDSSATLGLTGEGGVIVAGYSAYKKNQDDDNSVFLSRIGVKTGESVISSSSGYFTDESVSIIENPSVTVSDDVFQIIDADIFFSSKSISSVSVSTEIENLE